LKQIRTRLTYANVMSSLAVFLILGGATAFAAVKKIGANEIKANSIKTGKIVKEAVTQGKIKTSAVTEAKIADGAVTNKKLADNAVTTNKIADNAVSTGKIANDAVTTAKLANDAVTGAKVNEASLGEVPSANSANPVVFAKINADGTVNEELSKGITAANVTHPSKGVYCVTAPTFDARGGQAIPQFGGTSGTTVNLTVGGTGFCPTPAVQVITMITGAAPASENLTFYVELYH
jgi:hypothetical protein